MLPNHRAVSPSPSKKNLPNIQNKGGKGGVIGVLNNVQKNYRIGKKRHHLSINISNTNPLSQCKKVPEIRLNCSNPNEHSHDCWADASFPYYPDPLYQVVLIFQSLNMQFDILPRAIHRPSVWPIKHFLWPLFRNCISGSSTSSEPTLKPFLALLERRSSSSR